MLTGAVEEAPFEGVAGVERLGNEVDFVVTNLPPPSFSPQEKRMKTQTTDTAITKNLMAQALVSVKIHKKLNTTTSEISCMSYVWRGIESLCKKINIPPCIHGRMLCSGQQCPNNQ